MTPQRGALGGVKVLAIRHKLKPQSRKMILLFNVLI